MFLKLGEARGTSCYQLLVSPNFLSFMRSEVCTNVQLPDQKILWFRNSPPIESDKRPEEAQIIENDPPISYTCFHTLKIRRRQDDTTLGPYGICRLFRIEAMALDFVLPTFAHPDISASVFHRSIRLNARGRVRQRPWHCLYLVRLASGQASSQFTVALLQDNSSSQ